MKALQTLAVLLLLNSSATWAVNIYECEDEQGERSFHDRCPPGTTQLTKKQYSVKTGSPQKSSLETLTLYVVPDCDTCQQVREFLAVRNIAFNEKDVNENIDLQTELKEKAGNLKVPALVVGGQIVTGYERENTTLSRLPGASLTTCTSHCFNFSITSSTRTSGAEAPAVRPMLCLPSIHSFFISAALSIR